MHYSLLADVIEFSVGHCQEYFMLEGNQRGKNAPTFQCLGYNTLLFDELVSTCSTQVPRGKPLLYERATPGYLHYNTCYINNIALNAKQ